ncbi:hypothetical protein D9V29_02585 [Mycetocola manganoxydans]|uniref:LPXTG cell wall anchor domain-containing protein n=1 Tax=Mycetocola manganoxydans TaxID=699879 RepID=A0A3L7A0D8_9MICO|nr:hypothetical protein [Mycetocola manganoxydans]RLP72912.1 hypothetical protein D9V29_02585 [Mycetocola manganoxydans]GHD45016.1 hypothetical protein GCM10008097_13750 [Mycetocola manganoxydans]
MTIFTRIGAGLLASAAALALTLGGASVATADTGERSLSITRTDGSPVGTLFTDWTMVPGDKVSTTVLAHRTGGGESSLMITLGNNRSDREATPTPVEEDVVITVASNGIELASSAAALMHGDVMLDLGRSAAATVPIDVTFELPFASSNATQQQSIDLALLVVAADIPTSTDPADPTTPAPPADPTPAPTPGTEIPAADGAAPPALPSTGASVRDILIAAAVVTCIGLLLIGKRNRRDEAVDPH